MKNAAPRKPRGAGHERHLEIIQAARRVFHEAGYDRTTMRSIAQAAGLSPAGVYIYFNSKEAILAAIRDQTFLDLRRRSREAVARAHGPEERLRAILTSYLDFARSDPEAYRLTFRSRLIRAPRPGRRNRAGDQGGPEAFTDLVDGVAALIGPARPGRDVDLQIHAMAEAAWAAIHGLTSLVIDVPGFPVSGLKQTFDKLLSMILDGIRSHGAGQDDSCP